MSTTDPTNDPGPSGADAGGTDAGDQGRHLELDGWLDAQPPGSGVTHDEALAALDAARDNADDHEPSGSAAGPGEVGLGTEQHERGRGRRDAH